MFVLEPKQRKRIIDLQERRAPTKETMESEDFFYYSFVEREFACIARMYVYGCAVHVHGYTRVYVGMYLYVGLNALMCADAIAHVSVCVRVCKNIRSRMFFITVVDVYLWMHVYTDIRKAVCVLVYVFCVHEFTVLYVYMNTYTCVCLCTHICMCACVQLKVQLCTHKYLSTCMR